MENNSLEVLEDTLEESVPVINVQCQDYSMEFDELRSELQEVKSELAAANGYLAYSTGFMLFFVVVALCVFGYKFIRLFF